MKQLVQSKFCTAGEPARSPFFAATFHHLDLEIALRHELLQPRILRLELPQALDVVRLQSTETLAPSADRLLADAVPLGHRCRRIVIRLPDDRDHLLFRKTSFPGSDPGQLFLCRVSNFAQTPTVNGPWMKTSGALLHPRMK
jgi:hypothetical protein